MGARRLLLLPKTSVPVTYLQRALQRLDEILEPSSETVQAHLFQPYSYYYFPFGNLGSEQNSEGSASLGSSFNSIRSQYTHVSGAMCAVLGGLYPDSM